MKHVIWVSLIFCLIFNIYSHALNCNNKDRCLCIPGRELELQCPTRGEDLIIHIEEHREISIDCPKNLTHLKIEYFPNITVSNTEKFRLRFCPLLNEPFKNMFNRFYLQKVSFFEISASNMKHKKLTSDHFKGFENLSELKIADISNINLETDVFRNMPNLISLELSNSNIKIEPTLLKNLKKLIFLDLSGNNLLSVAHLFDSLRKLEILHLWNNNLFHLDEFIFRELSNLHSLELSINKIESISDKAFVHLKKLQRINLSWNKIKQVPENLFRANKKLKLVKMKYNLDLQLPNYLFANLSLVHVDLTNCRLKTIPENIFENTSTLEIIKLENNNIRCLPSTLFKGLINLVEIRLQNNMIEKISVFNDLIRLKSLHLQNNLIGRLEEKTFAELYNLEKINLKRNKIRHINNQFQNNSRLRIVILSYNKLTENTMDLKEAKNLRLLDLSHNQISTVKLKDFKLALKTFIKLNHNNITIVEFQGVYEKLEFPVILLSNNPINCDCRNYDLIQMLKKNKSNFLAKHLKCAYSSEFKNISPIYVPLNSITCSLKNTACPEKCSCSFRPYDKAVLINCSHTNLKQYPNLELNRINFQFNQTELYLEKNELEEGPPNLPGYDNVTKLILSQNKIGIIKWLPPGLEELRIDRNSINSLNVEIVEKLKKIKFVNLTGNPCKCNCNLQTLLHFIPQDKHSNLNLFCININSHLQDLKKSDLCSDFVTTNLIILILLFTMSSFTLFIAVYFYHKKRITMWLLSKKLFRFLASKENHKSKKIYDAFLSYSLKDEDFVVRYLLPKLEIENSLDSYKICLQYRNWIPGEFVISQIVESVEQSHRTIVILTQNYLDNYWANMVFQVANYQTISAGCPKIIVILCGTIDLSTASNELKNYLNTNTYLKLEDPYFWKKVKKAMPKPKNKNYVIY